VQPGEIVTGIITVNNQRFDISRAKDRVKMRTLLSYVPQDANLLLAKQLTVYQNIQLARLQKIPTLGFLPKIIDIPHMLIKINAKPGQQVSELSGGQRQLLAIILF
jgi:ABC-type branched-subunit amino acid transport system ATPase component